MKARKTAGKAKGKASTKNVKARRTGAGKTPAKAKAASATKKTPTARKATSTAKSVASEKYRQPGAPWWKPFI